MNNSFNNKVTKNNNNYNEQETQMLKMSNLYNSISKNIKSIRENQEECKGIMEQDKDKNYEKVNDLSTQSYELVIKGQI
jgi:Na+/H+-translocating membrane pyrophosphatase